MNEEIAVWFCAGAFVGAVGMFIVFRLLVWVVSEIPRKTKPEGDA